jgi:membrane protease YdiL (CAAX protease family)
VRALTNPWAPPPEPPGGLPGPYAPPVGPYPAMSRLRLPEVPTEPRWWPRPHAEPQPYLHLLRTHHHRWWKSLLGLLLVAVLWIGFQLVAGLVVLVHVLATGGSARDFDRLLEQVGPGMLLLTNLTLAVAIPVTGIAVMVCHQERMGWLSSVLGRVRWRMLFAFAGLAVAVMAVSIGVGAVLPGSAGGGLPELDPPALGTLVGVTLVVFLTTPLQAAGEEYLFRGYLAQAIGSWIPGRLAALIVTTPITATLFALAHGVQDPWLFADRFGFGVAASILVWLTGGLEAAIALHTVNNFVAFGFATLTGTLQDSLTSTEAPAGSVVLDLAVLTLFTAGVWMWTRRRPVRTRSDGPAPRAEEGPFWSP